MGKGTLAGHGAPTAARVVGCRPEGGSTFFRSERKYQRKHAARRLQRRPTSLCAVGFGLREPFGLSSASARCAHPPGKSPLLPIFERGSSQCRAQTSWRANSCYHARSCSLFSSFKKGKAFSLRCLSPLCSPAVGVGQTYPLRGDVVSTTGLLCRFNERRLMIPHSRRGAYAALAGILLPSQ